MRRWATALVVVASIAALAPACGHDGAGPPPSATVEVGEEASSLQLAGGLTVEVPADAVAGSGTLAGEIAEPPESPPVGMAFGGDTYHLEVEGTRVTGDVTLTLAVPDDSGNDAGGAGEAEVALLAFYDEEAERWKPVEATYDPAARTLSATVSHLSFWSVLRLDTGRALDAAKDALLGFIGASATRNNRRAQAATRPTMTVFVSPPIGAASSCGARASRLRGRRSCGWRTTASTQWRRCTRRPGLSAGSALPTR